MEHLDYCLDSASASRLAAARFPRPFGSHARIGLTTTTAIETPIVNTAVDCSNRHRPPVNAATVLHPAARWLETVLPENPVPHDSSAASP